MSALLRRLARDLGAEARVSQHLAERIGPPSNGYWVAEQRAYEDAALITLAASSAPGGVGRVHTTVEMYGMLSPNSVAYQIWQRVGAMLTLRTEAARRRRGQRPSRA